MAWEQRRQHRGCSCRVQSLRARRRRRARSPPQTPCPPCLPGCRLAALLSPAPLAAPVAAPKSVGRRWRGGGACGPRGREATGGHCASAAAVSYCDACLESRWKSGGRADHDRTCGGFRPEPQGQRSSTCCRRCLNTPPIRQRSRRRKCAVLWRTSIAIQALSCCRHAALVPPRLSAGL